MPDEIQVWTPTPFNGSDLLPIKTGNKIGPSDVPLIIENDMEQEDIRLPSIKLLQGTSDEVQKALIDGATPGRYVFTGSQTVVKPPVRFLVIARIRGNAMFVRPRDPDYADLETCISRDGIHGSRYGMCEPCGRCTEWRPDANGELKKQPLGSKTQQFVVWSSEGLAMLRVSMSNKFSTRNMRDLMTRRQTTGRNWWVHPMLLFADNEQNKDGDPFFVPRMRWDEKEVVPDTVQKQCFEWYGRVVEALKAGSLSDDEDQHPSQAKQPRRNPIDDSGPEGDDSIPF